MRTIEQHGATYYRVSRIVCAKVDGVDPIITRLEVPEGLLDNPQEAMPWQIAKAAGDRYAKGNWIFTCDEAREISNLEELFGVREIATKETEPAGKN